MSEPTQVAHPWRAAVRTAIQVIAGLAAAIPLIVPAIEGDQPGLLGPAGAVAVGVAAAVTRVMAIPAVNDLLTRLGLGAEPKG